MPKDHRNDRNPPHSVTDGARRILLMGNPNVGKSAVFSRLTGLQVISSNYPGTTVGFTQGSMSIGSERAFLIDVPGVYGLEATCKAEEVAIDMLRHADAVINVVDATNLERSLPLTLHLQELGIPLIVALNLWDEAGHRGIEIDVTRLEYELGVPVIPTVGVTGEGIKELIQRLEKQKPPQTKRSEENGGWLKRSEAETCLRKQGLPQAERSEDVAVPVFASAAKRIRASTRVSTNPELSSRSVSILMYPIPLQHEGDVYHENMDAGDHMHDADRNNVITSSGQKRI